MNTSSISTNRVMRMGFSIVILLMVLLAMLSLRQVKNINHSLHTIVEVVNKKIEHATNMREAIRLRRAMLNKMVATNDVFERDEEILRFYDLAKMYRNERKQLMSLTTNHEEELLHKVLTTITKNSQSITRNVLDRIATGETYKVLKQDLEIALAEQGRVLDILNELVTLQKRYSIEAVNKAKQDYETTIRQVLFIGGFIIALSIIIVTLVTRYVTRQNNELIQATRAKSDFLASMSHEIRTPLTAVIGFGESLTEETVAEKSRIMAANSIVKAGKHLLSIVNDILDISKIEANRMQVDLEKMALFDLMEEIESMLTVQAQHKNLKFVIDYHLPLPTHIITDAVRLKQIIINICGNAFKFTERGSVTINLRYINESNQLQCAITDTGIGLTEEQLARLFKPFAQADSSTTRKYGGTGLGLYLSKQLAEKLGGNIHVESIAGAGSRFTVSVSAGPSDQLQFIHAIPQPKQPAIKPVQHTKLGGRVLLAEDTEDNQRLLSYFIKKLGADIKIVENGLDAVKEAQAQTYDLILMDKQMPKMDGMEAVRQLRSQGYSGPIVALTANAMQKDKDECLEAGCDDFLSKPIDRIEFIRVLSRYLFIPANTASTNTRSDEYTPKIAAG